MKIISKTILSLFALAMFNSCEPEEIPTDSDQSQERPVMTDTGDQEGDIAE